VVIPVRFRYQSILDFAESQSLNISRSGMFVTTDEVLAVGTTVELEFSLDDGLPLLRGTATVTRAGTAPRGLGLQFKQLDEKSRSLIDRIVEVNVREGRKSSVPLDFNPEPAAPVAPVAPVASAAIGSGSGASLGVQLNGQDLKVELNSVTVSFFTNNPLLNIRVGGFVVPVADEVALGTVFGVTITGFNRDVLFSGKGKVVAKHEKRLGVRLTDVDKAVLTRLQGEVARLTPK